MNKVKQVKKYIITLTLLLISTSLYTGWNIDQIHKAQDSTRWFNYAKTDQGIHFFNLRNQAYSIYNYSFKDFEITDSLELNPGNQQVSVGDISYFIGPILHGDYLYLLGRDMRTPIGNERLFKININDYTDTINIHDKYDSLSKTVGNNANPYTSIRQSVNHFGQDVLIIYKAGDFYYVENDSVIYPAPIDTKGNDIGSIHYLRDSIILYRFNGNIPYIAFYRILEYNNNTERFSTQIDQQGFDNSDFWRHSRIINKDTLISVRSSESEQMCQVYRVTWEDNKGSVMLSYDSNHSNLTSNGQGGFILSLLDGRFYDSSFSTSSPIYHFDTLDIKPRQIEKVGFMDYIVFADQGVYRVYETLSVEKEESRRSTLDDYIISDVLGKVYYKGKEPRSNLPTTPGIYYLIGDKTEMMVVE